jgi:hypothetical protein
MTIDAAGPLTVDETRALADELAGRAGTLSARRRAALGEVLARAAVAPLHEEVAPRLRGPLLTDAMYDRLFARLGEVAPILTVPDA